MRLRIYCLLIFALSAGCKEQVAQIQAQVEQATKTVQQVAPASISPGEIQLNCGESITTKAGHIRIIVLGQGRPNIIQLRSYTDPKTEIFPSVLFQAPTDVTQVSDLVGKTISGTLFAQGSEQGTVYQTPLGKAAEVQFSKVEGKELVGTFSGGSMIDASGKTNPVSGTFRVVGLDGSQSGGSN